MATGANANYWEDHRLPGVLKLNLLRRYLPVFLIRTSSKTKHVAYVDGFAGRGTYGDGSLGSPGIMLEFAAGQKFNRDTAVDLYLCEKDAVSFADLSQLAGTYQKKGLAIDLTNGEAAEHLYAALPRVATLPTFIFEDPTGLGVPYADLVAAMNRNDSAAWPPTEMMINLSLEAIRRIGGHLTSATPNEKTMLRLDEALGGAWWRDELANGVSPRAVQVVVTRFAEQLGADTRSHVVVVPVLRAPGHQPVYYLVFCTRHARGVWNFGHCAAQATEDWWQGADAIAVQREEARVGDQLGLLPTETILTRPKLDEVEQEAMPYIADRINDILVSGKKPITLGDHSREVFGEYYGQVREKVARAAVKELHARDLTPSTGVGPKVENLVVAPVG
ncbi:three-Cys-motif partner protein TcmP [Mycolicibacterium austroafricanum]|uniref:three-Cys-motif partner protein TcmP n=1 Tax=Mycolicibacterium austroafricanum TaxID=39687 RepID=UPI000CF925EB|nr:three-Cys-motif partner protein TcmP [Mycolicibacterium austroafricanum]PQP48638.1 hypothetical protein C6A88_13585 [Mycolicibacterium austroafricanum]